MHGLEPQTIESINLLKQKKTPFLVALNKIDRLYDWQSAQRKDVRDILKMQQPNTQLEFEKRSKGVMLEFAEQVIIIVFIITLAVKVCFESLLAFSNSCACNKVIITCFKW